MSVAVQRRTCRTCPAVISGHGDTGLCRPCQQRSDAIRAVVAPEPPLVKATPPAAPKPRTCEQDGHHACRHFMAIWKTIQKFQGDADFCWVCGVEMEGDNLVHKAGCAYHVIEVDILAAPPAGREPREAVR